MNDSNLVSIIIPIYNVERYLRECLDSVVNQTYKNIEIILVNDGSPDLSENICREYQLKDSRIKYYVKSNGGLSDARNYGLTKATGDYIIFLDSDDVADIRQIEVLLKNLKKYNATVSCCMPQWFTDDKTYKPKELSNNIKCYSGKRFAELMMRPQGVFCYAWGRLMTKELAEKIQFPKGKLFEDIFTMPKLFYNEEKIVLTKDELYYYRYRKTSLSHCKFNYKSMDEMDAYLFMLNFGQEVKNRKLIFYSAVFFVTKYHYYYCRVIKHKMDLDAYKKKYKESSKYCWKKILTFGR